MAIVLVVFVTCVVGMLDLGMAVFRYHMLAEASRQGARLAIVHGKLADRLGPWGPTGFTVSADDAANPLAVGVRPLLAGMNPSDVTIQAQWPDAGNDSMSDHRVRVTVSTTYNPITLLVVRAGIPLQASSTMFITH
jgi:Flp pilus assembly protein TadG